MPPAISIILPACNEAECLAPLVDEILAVVAVHPDLAPVEIIVVDDGSTDGTWQVVAKLCVLYPETVRGVRLRRNFGKSAALQTGFDHARGGFVVTLDADGQDDPAELPRFIAALREGADLVSGWKTRRLDPWHKTLPSRFFNFSTRVCSGVRLRDFNCGYKAYRREALEGLGLHGELHRFIPVLVAARGFNIAELSVNHRLRRAGRSKFGLARLLRGPFDLLTVLTMTRYYDRPGHLFGGLGLMFGSAGAIILGYLGILWCLGERPIGTRPLFFVGILAVMLAAQLLSLGLIAELLKRPHGVAAGAGANLVRERINVRPNEETDAGFCERDSIVKKGTTRS
jgi:glycosyltransferase involved in cell wall biosynthesis